MPVTTQEKLDSIHMILSAVLEMLDDEIVEYADNQRSWGHSFPTIHELRSALHRLHGDAQ